MADPKSIHEFLTGEGKLGSLFLMDNPDAQAQSGYTTQKLPMTDLGDFINNGIDYTQDLDTENKKIIGAINELHGVDGYDVYDETRTSSNKYVQGDICIHSDSLQVCTDANGAYGAWDSSKWSPTTIKDLLALKANTSDIPTKTSDLTNDSGFPVATTVSWGTSITIKYIKSNFLMFLSNQLFVLWFYGNGYTNIDIRDISTNNTVSGAGTVTLGSITVTRTSDGFTVTLTGNSTITVIG